jgi:hypothetical protein
MLSLHYERQRRTNGKTPSQLPAHLLLTTANKYLLHFTSYFRRKIHHDDDDDDNDDDDANDDSTTALDHILRLF